MLFTLLNTSLLCIVDGFWRHVRKAMEAVHGEWGGMSFFVCLLARRSLSLSLFLFLAFIERQDE